MKKKIKVFKYHQKAQSLLEVLTALGVAILVIAGLSALAVFGLRNAQHAKNTEIATRLTGQGIEQVRTVRDRNGWTQFAAYAVDKCYKVDSSSWLLILLPSCDLAGAESFSDPAFSNFKRRIALVDDGENGRKVKVSVFWTDSQGPNQVSSDTILTRWQ